MRRGVADLVRVQRLGLVHRVRLVDLELALQDVADPPDVLQVVRDDPDADQVSDLGQGVLVLRALPGDLLDEAVDGLGAGLDLDDLEVRTRQQIGY